MVLNFVSFSLIITVHKLMKTWEKKRLLKYAPVKSHLNSSSLQAPIWTYWNEGQHDLVKDWNVLIFICGISFAALDDFRLHGSHFAGSTELFCINFLCLLFNAALTWKEADFSSPEGCCKLIWEQKSREQNILPSHLNASSLFEYHIYSNNKSSEWKKSILFYFDIFFLVKYI